MWWSPSIGLDGATEDEVYLLPCAQAVLMMCWMRTKKTPYFAIWGQGGNTTSRTGYGLNLRVQSVEFN